MTEALPRDRHCSPHVTAETCERIRVSFEPDGLTGLVVPLDRPWHRLRPENCAGDQPTREDLLAIRPGDAVWWLGERHVVRGVELYR